MAGEVKLTAQPRTKLGSKESRRLRNSGRVPCNMFGHGEGNIHMSVDAGELSAVMHSGTHVVEVQIDDRTETAMFREVQWDTFGQYVQHFDLQRVDVDERVTVEVSIELRGIAPGTLNGGVLEQSVYEIEMECSARDIPDSLSLNINDLEIGSTLHLSDLDLPEGATTTLPADAVIVSVNEPVEVVEEEEVEVGPVEPEVIGRESEDESEES